MDISKFNVEKLDQNQIESIFGGDRITRAVFRYFGRLFGHISAAMEAEARHGVH